VSSTPLSSTPGAANSSSLWQEDFILSQPLGGNGFVSMRQYCSMALSAGCRVIVPDIEACDAMVGTADLTACRRADIRAGQSTPLVSRSGQLLGMISTYWRKPHRPTECQLRHWTCLPDKSLTLIERGALRFSKATCRYSASARAIPSATTDQSSRQPNSRTCAFHVVTIPSSVLPIILSAEDVAIAARRACASPAFLRAVMSRTTPRARTGIRAAFISTRPWPSSQRRHHSASLHDRLRRRNCV
jgi:hypothetical protein